ncbi:MAG TPA: DUF2254 domain-containing protein [Nocardioidaceae bacterium]|nr:DUF2254 domain-containing protein [Nocardioidaceae bacterium]
MSLWVRLRERFWFLPGVLCVVAVGLAEGLITLDQHVGDFSLGPLSGLISRVGAAGSRDLLGAIASSMLTVAATTFSITIAVLALASTNYGPRLVRNFMTDRANQFVLGVYVATFLYSLLVLRSIRVNEDGPAEPFVPHLAVNVAVALAVLAIGVLVYFIHHISDSVQVWTLAREVHNDLVDSVDHLYPDRVGREPQETPGATGAADVPPGLATDGVPVPSERTGYVQSVAQDKLLAVAGEHDVVISLQVRPGSHVYTGVNLAVVWPPDNAGDALLAGVAEAVVIGQARSPHQDAEFAVLMLEEMAVRALSPSTNDPYTAINALDGLAAGLVLMAGRHAPSTYRYDSARRLRVIAPRVVLTDLLDRVLDAMRLYAIDHPSVLHRTLTLTEQVGTASDKAEVHARLAVHVERLLGAFADSSLQDCDRHRLQEHAAAVRRALADTPSEDRQ